MLLVPWPSQLHHDKFVEVEPAVVVTVRAPEQRPQLLRRVLPATRPSKFRHHRLELVEVKHAILVDIVLRKENLQMRKIVLRYLDVICRELRGARRHGNAKRQGLLCLARLSLLARSQDWTAKYAVPK